MKNQNYLNKLIITLYITLFLLAGFTKADLPFDPNDYSFLVYDPGNNYNYIRDAMEYLGITCDWRDSDLPVTANDLATHDILIVGENAGGDVTGLDDEDLAVGITGRVILTGHDLDQHIEDYIAAETMFIQAIDWVLKDGGTGLIALACDQEYPYLPAEWGITAECEIYNGNDVNEFTAEGLASGVYDGLEPDQFDNWHDSYHNIFTIGSSSSFVSFELGGDGDTNDIITVACILSGIELTKTDDVNDGNSVLPGDEITYTISYSYANDPNLPEINDVVITDYLPAEVTYEALDLGTFSIDPNYSVVAHTYTWNIGTLSPGESNSVTLNVKVNELAEPLGKIINRCVIYANEIGPITSFESTDVNAWTPPVIYVDVNATGSNTGMSWQFAYRDLQDALARAAAGCGSEIWVAKGTYFTHTDPNPAYWGISFELSNGVGLYGGFAGNETSRNQRNWLTNETILDGDVGGGDISDTYYLIKAVNIDQTAIVDGFTIREGYYAGIIIDNASVIIRNSNIIESVEKGIECINQSSVDITNCAINGNGNSDNDGAGIYNNGCSSFTIEHCTFSGNEGDSGGGLYNYSSNPSVTNCIFSGNHAAVYGGGVYNESVSSSAEFANNIFYDNEAGNRGGGMCNSDSSNPNVVNCIFSGNAASDYGGGMYNRAGSSPAVESCIFSNNSAESEGGGMCDSDSSNPNVVNCIFYKNQTTLSSSKGGGISNYKSSPTLINCTFSGNSADPDYNGEGGGMYNYQSSPTVTSCIFWADSAHSGNEIYNYSSSYPIITYCDIQGGGWSGEGNIDANPCFVDADANNYHLTSDSPCIDAGDPCFNPDLPETDIDGQGRIIDGDYNDSNIVDIGADEYYWRPPDFKPDGIVNFFDYAKFTSAWLTNDSDYNLDGVGVVDYEDLELFCDDWLWTADWYQPIEFTMMAGGMDRGIAESLSLAEAVEPSVEIERISPVPIPYIDRKKVILDLLAELWLDPDVREAISEDDWLKFVESIKSTLE